MSRLVLFAALLALAFSAPCQQDVATTVAPCEVTTTPAPPPPCQADIPQGPCVNDLEIKTPCEELLKEDKMPSKVNWTDYDCTRLQMLEDEKAAQDSGVAYQVIRITENPKIKDCKNGWIVYKESCYYVETQAKTLQNAEKACLEKDATLFVADSREEFNTIMKPNNQNAYTWIGLFKEREDKEPIYHVQSGMNYKDLPWLVKPYSHSGNGWTSVSQGAAFWNPSTELGKYVFWYPPGYLFNSICEYNQTLSADIKKKVFF